MTTGQLLLAWIFGARVCWRHRCLKLTSWVANCKQYLKHYCPDCERERQNRRHEGEELRSLLTRATAVAMEG